jgi:S-adenosylmethionine-dependent methyltransferase
VPPKHPAQDRNFDDLTPRFRRNIYHTLKGQIRLAVLARDFAEHLPSAPSEILDVGAGLGQFALQLAQQGHRLTLVDLSAQMLAEAEQAFAAAQVSASFICCPLQSLAEQVPGREFDGVMCHAVMEWLVEPYSLVAQLKPWIKPGGWLSLLFYNLHGVVFKNLLRTNFKKVAAQDFRGRIGSLTPLNPLEPEQVRASLAAAGFELLCHSGVRVFHDYILDDALRERQGEALIAQELAFSQQLPYRDLGRYVHLLARLPE